MSIKEISQVSTKINEVSKYIETPESKEFNLTDLSPYLSEDNQIFLSPISQEFKIYLNCLKKIPRWKKHCFEEVGDELQENDYDHVLDMFKISKELRESEVCNGSINFDEVELMILLHDGGEIITGDISLNNNILDKDCIKKIKEIESRAFGPCVLRRVKDLEIREKLRDLYNRYNNRHQNPNDIESHLVKLIDMSQGNTFGMENIYSKEILNKYYEPENPFFEDSSRIVSIIVGKEISQTKNIVDCLESPHQKNFFSIIIMTNI